MGPRSSGSMDVVSTATGAPHARHQGVRSRFGETRVSAALEILYIGGRHRDEVASLAEHGARLREVETIYEGIVHLKRHYAGAVVVDHGVLGPSFEKALDALHAAAGDRPLLVVMTVDQWDEVRAAGLLRHEEVLLRPFYPDELWERVHRTALPPPSKAVTHFRSDADRLAALMHDAQQLNRFTGDLSALTHHCASIVKTRLRAGRVSIFLKERTGEELKAWEAERLDPRVREELRMRLGEGVAGSLAAKRRVVLVREAGRDGPGSPRTYERPSYVIAPLVPPEGNSQ